MIRVVHIVNIDIGPRIHLRNQLLHLRQRGYDVSAICSPGPRVPNDGVTPEGIPVKVIQFSQAMTPFQDVSTFIQLLAYLRRERFDIVHTHSLKPGLLGRLAARLARVPVIVHTIHGFFFYDGMPVAERALWKRVEKLGMSLGDYALSQSQEDVDTAIRERIFKPDRIGYLGNGIDLEEFDPTGIPVEQVLTTRRELGVGECEKVVAMAGRLLVEKGYLEFFEAARLIRERDKRVRFWAMGASQPNKQGAISLTGLQVRGPDQGISFLGMRSDMPQVLAAVDVFLLPTHGREGVPRVLMEASAMSKPIIATNVRGCREAVIDGQTGLLVPPRNAAALAEAVLTLLDDSSLANRLASAARAHAKKHFDERIYFSTLEATYDSLLKARGMR